MQEYFRNRINEISLGWIRTMLGNIHDKNSAIESLSNIQEITQDDYDGRFLYELFQNAKDVSGCSKIKIVLQDGKLLFCNNGIPIADNDFDALCSHAISSKRDNDEQTGKFGIGKASYFEISETNHRVYSKSSEDGHEFDGYCFELASDKAIQYQTNLLDLHLDSVTPFGDIRIFDRGYTEHYIQDIINNDPDGIQRQQGLERIGKNLAIPLNEIPEDIKYLTEEFSTVFYFIPDNLKDIEIKLCDFSSALPNIFLFLPERIKEISVICNGTTTNYYRYAEENLSEYGETRIHIGKECCGEKEEKRFFIWEKIASDSEMAEIYSAAPEKIKQRNPLKITIALAPDDIDNEGIYFCDLPTEESTGMNLYVDANFHIRSDRKSIHLGNEYNKKLLDFSASAVKNIVQRVLEANNGVPCTETATLIKQLLCPHAAVSKNSEIYNSIKNLIDVANLPCVWSVRQGLDSWSAPNKVFAPLERIWEAPITENEFYKRTCLPILSQATKKISTELINLHLSTQPFAIPHQHLQNILFSFIKDSFLDREGYIKTWQVVVKNWSDLIDDSFADEEIFLGNDQKLYSGKSVYLQNNKKDLLATQSVAGIPYPFIELESSFSDFISNYQEEDIFDGKPERMRLVFDIRGAVKDFVNEFIKKIGGTQETKRIADFCRDNKNVSVENMAAAIKTITAFWQSDEAPLKKDFLMFINQKALMIYVATEDMEDAFRMFTILNDRGVQLRNSDILKSINLGAVDSEAEKTQYATLWEEAESTLGDGFDRFLNFIRTILVKDKARLSLLKEFEDKIYSPKERDKSTGIIKPQLLKKGRETFEFVKKYLSHYSAIFDATHYDIFGSYEFDNLLRIMNYGLPASDWIPPLLYYYDKFNCEHLLEFLRLLNSKFAGDWIGQYSPTYRIESMNQILRTIENSSSASEVLASGDFNFDKESFWRTMEGNIYGRRFALYAVLLLDYKIADHQQKMNFEKLSIEHILPQHPNSETSQWCKDFTDADREEWTNKLGNLVIIPGNKNTSLGNLDFPDKKERYFKSRVPTCPRLGNIYAAYSQWTLPDLKKNHEKSLSDLKNLFKIEG